MKKVLVSIAFLFSVAANAQLQKVATLKSQQVGKVSPGGLLFLNLSYVVNETDTLYTFSYKDMEYKHIDVFESVVFKGNAQTINDLYKILADAFSVDNPKEYRQDLKLGDESVSIIGYKSLGIKGVRLIKISKAGNISSSFTMGKGHLDKLFNK
jgi:hypothetical protein